MNALRRNKRTAGFTLIELLVVMGVITILVSLIVPTIGKVRQQAHITALRATIDSLSSALEKYMSVNHRYPPDRHPQLTRSSQALVYYLSGSTMYNNSPGYPWTHSLYGAGSRATLPVYYDFPPQVLKGFSESNGIAPGLVDPWGNTLIYNSGSSSNGSYNRYNSAKHGERKFDIFSAGPDREYGNEDDITNWEDELPWGYLKDEDGVSLDLKDGTH